ncbi:MAG: 2-hydroxyacyl-CoA dehydratase [Candidatus Lokiarchaeota archaeon]|nr:2-hydroxyacyl-CoA dehydratase [Candidatus Lokiarchaeota archaeon]
MSVDEFKQKYELWDNLRQFFTLGRDMAANFVDAPNLPAFNIGFLDVMVDYMNNLYNAEKNGTPIAMYNFCVPPELFYAGNLYPLCQEVGSVALAIANTPLHMKYIDKAEESGLAREQCNAQKIWIGATLQEATPKPNMIVYASQPCDSTNILYQVMKNYYKVPTFTFDIPYWHYDEKNEYYDERTLPYCANQLKKMIKFIEKNGNTEITFENLKKTVENSNKAREYTLEFLELLKHKPNPAPSMIPFTLYMTLMTSAGLSGNTIEYAKWCRDDAKEKIKNGTGAIHEMSRGKKEEKYRCFWVYIPIFFDPMLFSWMETKFQVSTVMDMMGYQMAQPIDTSSEESMLTDMSKTILEMPMARQSRGPMEYYLDDVVRIVKEYQVDFCIWGGHLGCKHSWAIASLMKKIVQEETGVPMLVFEVDTMDSRIIKSKEIKKKIKEFITDVVE